MNLPDRPWQYTAHHFLAGARSIRKPKQKQPVGSLYHGCEADAMSRSDPQI